MSTRRFLVICTCQARKKSYHFDEYDASSSEQLLQWFRLRSYSVARNSSPNTSYFHAVLFSHDYAATD
jgi:hypothetical protein